ncbi:interleukin-20-like [Synchiropus splendidus]|uniref:interleukin-20-like n=1 Tax=Synchiropus splendidus TaxID=270530 RepID=UPI00237EDFFA|nr:interleukin-20-like [Synchiropus splendidus]
MTSVGLHLQKSPAPTIRGGSSQTWSTAFLTLLFLTALHQRETVTMLKMLLSCCLALLLLSGLVETLSLSLGTCTVTVHTHELRKHYSDLRSSAIEGDHEIGVKLLNKSWMENILEGQKCCFLRLLLRFYVERVFSNYVAPESVQQRCSSALANAFVTIRRDMNRCHCHCAEETQRTMDALQAQFVKLQIKPAAQKGVAELDTVLDWLEG